MCGATVLCALTGWGIYAASHIPHSTETKFTLEGKIPLCVGEDSLRENNWELLSDTERELCKLVQRDDTPRDLFQKDVIPLCYSGATDSEAQGYTDAANDWFQGLGKRFVTGVEHEGQCVHEQGSCPAQPSPKDEDVSLKDRCAYIYAKEDLPTFINPDGVTQKVCGRYGAWPMGKDYDTHYIKLDGSVPTCNSPNDGNLTGLSVFKHEIGHLAGLLHSEDERDIMYPQGEKRISANDRNRLLALYARTNVTKGGNNVPNTIPMFTEPHVDDDGIPGELLDQA